MASVISIWRAGNKLGAIQNVSFSRKYQSVNGYRCFILLLQLICHNSVFLRSVRSYVLIRDLLPLNLQIICFTIIPNE